MIRYIHKVLLRPQGATLHILLDVESESALKSHHRLDLFSQYNEIIVVDENVGIINDELSTEGREGIGGYKKVGRLHNFTFILV